MAAATLKLEAEVSLLAAGYRMDTGTFRQRVQPYAGILATVLPRL